MGWVEAGKQGLPGLEVPEAYGGSAAGDFRFNAVMAEELSKFNAAASSSFGIHTDGVAPYLVELGTEEQKQRWLPGWIDHVEHHDFGGGILTVTLFGDMDPSLYADLKATQEKGFGVASAEKTLRTWFHRADKKIGQVLEWKEQVNPPPGSSGIQIRLTFTELLEGYRPGRSVRVKCHDWLFVTMPPEERMKSLDEQKRSAVLSLP